MWPLRTRGGKSSPASPRVSTKPQDGTESGPGQQVTSHPPRGTHPGQAALTNHPAVGNLACNVAATKRQPLLLTSPHSGAGTIPLIKESWPPKSRSESHTVRAGLGPVSVLHGMSGSLSIKEKNQDSVLYQIPILHHRQRAEEAQEGKGPRQASHKAGRAEALRNQPGSQRRNRNPQVQSQQGLGEAEAWHMEAARTWGRLPNYLPPSSAPRGSPPLLTFTAGGLESPLSTPNTSQHPLHFCSSSDRLNMFFRLW